MTRELSRRGPVVPARTDRIWSVSEFSHSLKSVLESTFGRLQVRGEISGLARPRSGHLYFSLVDDRPVMGSRTSSSQLGAVMWRSDVGRLRFEPEDGMKVVVTGRLTVYEPRSVYQLVADHIEPEGLGDLHLAFERLKEKLGAEGLFDDDRKRALPFLPRRIGVVTSPSGAAVRDFLKTLAHRNPRVSVRIVPVRVQGEGSAVDIAQAIDLLGRPEAGVDVIVVTRGGGSLEDLWAFNEEVVARALSACEVPTVSAVGHEVDFTVADFVADRRAPTPTAAAAVVCPDLAELLGRLDALRAGLVHGLRAAANSRENRLLRAASSRHFQNPQVIVQERFGDLDRALESLENHLYKRLERWHDSLILLGTRLRGLSPFAILERGYSVALDRDGRALRSASSLEPGDAVEIRFASGTARTRVENVDTDGRAGSERDRDERVG